MKREGVRDVFQALADPSRRAMIMLLAASPMTPNGLSEHFEMSRQAVSKHIQVLADCNLVKQARSGREIYYHFNHKQMKEIDKWLEKLRKIWEDRFDQLDELLTKIK